MKININLNKNFIACVNRLEKKYGEKFLRINGFSNDKLNFSEFIDRYTADNDKLVDIVINPTANMSLKDNVAMLNNMHEPHQKLLAFNKIYYEITKKYGRERANEWLESVWCGALYFHDAPSSSFFPYCYFGTECVTVKYNNQVYYINFKELFDLVQEVAVEVEPNTFQKNIQNLYVLDIVNGEQSWSKVSRVVKHSNNKAIKFVKLNNGLSCLTTEDHPYITQRGDVQANQLKVDEDQITTYKVMEFADSIHYFNNIELTPDLGYLVGMYLSEGYKDKKYNYYYICQKNDTEINQKIKNILDKYNIKWTEQDERKILICNNDIITQLLQRTVVGNYCDTKHLNPEFINYSEDFLLGIIAGMTDGDGSLTSYKNRVLNIRITSRTLLNQLSLILQYFGYNVRDRIPYIYNRQNSFISKKTIYGIECSLGDNQSLTTTIDSVKIKTKYIPKIKFFNSRNSKYSIDYGSNKVSENITIDSIEANTVYDITTETGHFLCNNILSHNCWATSLKPVAEKGLYFIEEFKTRAAHHLSSFCDHVLETVGWLSNRQAGAVGLPDLLIYMYYFWWKDTEAGHYIKNPEYYARQCMQKVIYDMNQPYLRIVQSAFTNVTIMDHEYLIGLFGGNDFPDGTPIMDHIDNIIEFEKMFMEEIHKAREEHTFTYPVLTYSLLYQNGKFVDEEFARWCSDTNVYWMDSNFFVGSDITSLSSCCRLINDTSKLSAFINSIGGTALQVGSVKVSTINLRRISLESYGDEDEFISLLHKYAEINLIGLDRQRHIIKRNIEKGLLPNYTSGLVELEKQYSTIGITAMYEAMEDFGYIDTDEFGNKSYSKAGLDFAVRILDTLNEIKDAWAANVDYSVNIEAVPGESCNIKLAEEDSLLFPEAKSYYIYGNQWIPLREKCTMAEKIKLGALLDVKCGGGQISHINIDGHFANNEQAWELLNHIAKSGVIYFAFNSKIKECANGHHWVADEHCPHCGEKAVKEYTRIVGFLRPVDTFSKPRAREYDERTWFPTENILEVKN